MLVEISIYITVFLAMLCTWKHKKVDDLKQIKLESS
jgi:hypothetical protein